MIPYSAIRRQIYQRHYLQTVEITIGQPLTDEEYLAFKREKCEVHRGGFCDCTLEDFRIRTAKMIAEIFSKPPYLSFVGNKG